MSEEKVRATIDQAKAAWEAHPEPSLRVISDILGKQGLVCTVPTLQRWHKAGWILKGKTRNEAKTSEKAQAEVAMGVKKQDDATLTRLEAIAIEEAALKQRAEELAKVEQDSELARQAMRSSLIAQIVLAEQVTRRAAFLAEAVPGIIAKMLESLKGPSASTTIVVPPSENNGDDARVINGRVIEESAAQIAISAFKARQRQGVAA